MKNTLLFILCLMALSGLGYAFDVTLYSENLTTNVKNYTAGFLPCYEAIKSGVNITQDNVWYVWTYKKNGGTEQIYFYTVNTSAYAYTITLYPEYTLSPGDNIYVELLAANGSNTSQIYYDEQVNKTYCFEGTTTTSSSTSTTGGVTTTTMVGTTTSGGSTSSSPSTTTYTPSTYPNYEYTIPNGNYGTLPGLNGTGGNTSNNGTLKNMPCTGFCIIGLNKTQVELYAAIMITILVLIGIKPVKLGATASAIALAFFNSILGWNVTTASLQLIFIFLAIVAWKEDVQ